MVADERDERDERKRALKPNLARLEPHRRLFLFIFVGQDLSIFIHMFSPLELDELRMEP